jgi:uncharacterized protein YndB with AHSA1/START domain
MTNTHLMGSLSAAGGKGVVRVEDRFDVSSDALWSALTDPRRLARWLGEVEGRLRLGGMFQAHFFASGWRGTGRIEACEPGQRLLVATTQEESTEEQVIEVTLTAAGDGTILAWEERGMPTELVAAYGAGVQVHVEDLGAYLAGGGRCDADARFGELYPAYQELAAA